MTAVYEINDAIDQVLRFIQEERHFTAEKLYSSVLRFLNSPGIENAPEFQPIRERIIRETASFQLMVDRVALVKPCLDISEEINEHEQWIYGVSMFGVVTHYMIQSDGSLRLRLQGSNVEAPVFEQLAVFREPGLYYKWLPFCKVGQFVDHITPLDYIIYLNVQIPLLSREAAIRFQGVDCLRERGEIIFYGKSVDDWNGKIPWKPVSWFHNKSIVNEFKAIIKVNSPTSCSITCVVSIDPNAPLPDFLVNFVLQKLAGCVISRLQTQALEVSNHPECKHGDIIRGNEAFYSNFLLPKIRNYCEYKNWTQPVVSSLNEEGKPPRRTSAFEMKPTGRRWSVMNFSFGGINNNDDETDDNLK
eukprot:gene1304-2518_t